MQLINEPKNLVKRSHTVQMQYPLDMVSGEPIAFFRGKANQSKGHRITDTAEKERCYIKSRLMMMMMMKLPILRCAEKTRKL